jgi:16S rRNA (cytidine1402-2'-O)-methyltransferase
MAAVISNAQSNQQHSNLGTLYVVATPIGNLADVSDRMRHTLSQVNRIAAEDTRRTKQLLSHIGVDTPCFSMHDYNERQKIDWVVQLLQSGESIALVSDAGTPLISDPGYP